MGDRVYSEMPNKRTGTFNRTTSMRCNQITLIKHILNQHFYQKFGFWVISQSILDRFSKFKDQNIGIFERNGTV